MCARPFEREVVVTDEDDTITATYPDGTVKAIGWSDLIRIEVHTNDTESWGADVWWVLAGEHGECVYPQGATGDTEMIAKYQELDGFDDDELIKAMGCTGNRSFVCWSTDRSAVPGRTS